MDQESSTNKAADDETVDQDKRRWKSVIGFKCLMFFSDRILIGTANDQT